MRHLGAASQSDDKSPHIQIDRWGRHVAALKIRVGNLGCRSIDLQAITCSSSPSFLKCQPLHLIEQLLPESPDCYLLYQGELRRASFLDTSSYTAK